MSDFLIKLIEIFLNRKDKFKKADERYARRVEFFEKVQSIKEDNDLSEEARRALLDSAAQKLTGSPRVTYEVVDYYIRNKEFINFEVIAPSVWFWDESIKKSYDSESKLINIELDQHGYKKEKKYLGFSVFVMFLITVYFLLLGHKMVNFLAGSFYVSKSILGPIFLLIPFLFFCFMIFMGVLYMSHNELPELLVKKKVN